MIFLAAPPARRTHSSIYHSLWLRQSKNAARRMFLPGKISMREILCVYALDWPALAYVHTHHIYHWRTFAHSLMNILFRFIWCHVLWRSVHGRGFKIQRRAACLHSWKRNNMWNRLIISHVNRVWRNTVQIKKESRHHRGRCRLNINLPGQ